MATLRSHAKYIFLVTNSHIALTDLTMTATLGQDWKDFFDTIIFNARKPLFHRTTSPFITVDPHSPTMKGNEIHSDQFLTEHLAKDKLLLEGNI